MGNIGDRWNDNLLNKALRMIMPGADIVSLHQEKYGRVDDGRQRDRVTVVAQG
ncbi:MAG TPA: hypothetical protein V6D03_07530 [Candidatus Caenarcaniphilales bacterium]